jgi:hypothetical protein
MEFANAIERIQLSLDLRVAGYEMDRNEYLSEFREMEAARARVDIVGTLTTRVWSYRCRLAVSGMERVLREHGPDGGTYRAKLHEARFRFVNEARAELGFSDAPLAQTDAAEDSAAGHEEWLQSGATADARTAVLVPYAELSSWGFPTSHEVDPSEN